jgi:hypothetical protein
MLCHATPRGYALLKCCESQQSRSLAETYRNLQSRYAAEDGRLARLADKPCSTHALAVGIDVAVARAISLEHLVGQSAVERIRLLAGAPRREGYQIRFASVQVRCVAAQLGGRAKRDAQRGNHAIALSLGESVHEVVVTSARPAANPRPLHAVLVGEVGSKT